MKKSAPKPRLFDPCGCLRRVRDLAVKKFGETAQLVLVQATHVETGELTIELPPLVARWKEGGKWRKEHMEFSFCPFCGEALDAAKADSK